MMSGMVRNAYLFVRKCEMLGSRNCGNCVHVRGCHFEFLAEVNELSGL